MVCSLRLLRVIATMFVFASIVVPTTALRAATTSSIDALPGGCIHVTPPGSDEPVCCVSGFVYVEGKPVVGAEVTITNGAATVTVLTQTYSGLDNRPFYRASLSAAPLNVTEGATITITARYGGHEKSISYRVARGGQQVDVVLAQEQTGDYVFDHQIWHQSPADKFTAPIGFAVNSTGEVITTDYANARVQVFSPDAKALRAWGRLGNLPGEFSQPNGVAVDRNNNIYVADSGNRRIQKFDSGGHLIAIWGSHGDLDGQFNYPTDLDIDRAGNIYVSDNGNHRIQKFASDGTWLKSWRNKADGAGELINPWGIVVSNNDEVFVIERGTELIRSSIEVYTANGDPLRRWETHQQDGVKLNDPVGIALDDNGNVYVTDSGRLLRFHADGSAGVLVATGSSKDAGVVIGSNDHIYVAAGPTGGIREFDLNGKSLNDWSAHIDLDGHLDEPRGIVIAPSSGQVYIANRGYNRVQAFKIDGTPLVSWHADNPSSIAADAAGNVYVVEMTDQQRIVKHSSDGAVLATWDGSGSFSNPITITASIDGVLYVADVVNDIGRIRKLTSNGSLVAWGSGAQLQNPTGVAVDQSGNVYVTDRDASQSHGQVQKFSPSGVFLRKWPVLVSNRESIGSPTGVSVDSGGNVYVTDTRTTPGSIHKYTADGVPVATWEHIRENGGLRGLAVDGSGKVFVVDDVNNTIDVFRPMASALPIATIQWLSNTSLNASDNLQGIGLGQESVSGHDISAYRWTLDSVTVIGTGSTLTKPASSFTPGSHSLSFDVQDSAGEWSASVSKSFYVAKLVGAAPWTMLLYLDGDYHDGGKLSSQFTATLENLRQHLANPSVRIAVQLDGPANGDTRRITIAPPSSAGGAPMVSETPVGEAAMDDPATLADFIRWGQGQLPAQHYYLAIANHGQAVQGIGWDSTSDPSDGAYLTVRELGEALQSPGVAPIDVLHLDACSLNLLDVAYEVRDSVRTLVASQYLGWSYFAYDDYAAAIGSAATARDVARTIVDHYAALARADNVPFTLSALDLGRSTTTLSAVDVLAAELAADITNNRGRQATIDDIRNKSQTFDSDGNFQNLEGDMYVDLADWTRRVQSEVDNPAVKARATALLAELTGTQPFILRSEARSGPLPVQYGGHYINLSGANGLSVFYPQRQDTVAFNNYVNDQLFRFSSASRWKTFLQAGVGALVAPGAPLAPLPGPLPTLLPSHQVFLPLVVNPR